MAGTYTQGGPASRSAELDTPPPSPPEKRLSVKPSPPGADTRSLLGADSANQFGNEALSSPGGKLLLGTSMLIQAVNLIESIAPGLIAEPVKMQVAMLMEQAPLLAEQMARQSDPMALLSAVGQSGTPAPMGMPAMTGAPMQGAGMGMPMPAGPAGTGGGMPMMPSGRGMPFPVR